MIRLIVGALVGVWIASFCMIGYNFIRPDDRIKIRKPVIGLCLLGYSDMMLIECGLFGFGLVVNSYIMAMFFALELSNILQPPLRN